MKTRADRIRYIREDVLGLTQQQLAEKLGVERGSVTNWERNRSIGRKNLFLLASLSSCSPEWIEKGEGEKPARNLPVLVKPRSKDHDKNFVRAVIDGMARGFGLKTPLVTELDQLLQQGLKEFVTADSDQEALAQVRAVTQFAVSQFLASKRLKDDEK